MNKLTQYEKDEAEIKAAEDADEDSNVSDFDLWLPHIK